MASRDYLRHLVSETFTDNAAIGDELFQPSSDKLYKRLVIRGTTVEWAEIPHIASDGRLDIGSLASVNSLTGIYSDRIGNLRDLVAEDRTSAHTLLAIDNGKLINITTGGITIPANVFTPGNNVTIFNNSASSQTITATAVTCYLAGTATTGNRTLAQRGICTIVCVGTNTFVISGAGLT